MLGAHQAGAHHTRRTEPSTAARTPRKSPRRRLRHGIRAHPLPPAGFTSKNFCKSGLPQNHMLRARQIKDPQGVEDLQRRIIFAGFYSLKAVWIATLKAQPFEYIEKLVLFLGI
jgi:hypothetical protein